MLVCYVNNAMTHILEDAICNKHNSEPTSSNIGNYIVKDEVAKAWIS